MFNLKTDNPIARISFRPSRPMGFAWASVLLAMISLLAGCTHAIPVGTATFSDIKPPSQKLPVTVGIYFSPEFRAYEEQIWKKGDRWDFPLGSPSVALFNQAIPFVFEKAFLVQARPPLESMPEAHAVIEVRMEGFDFQLPWLKTGTYSAEIAYRIILYNQTGDAIVSWVVQGIGEKPGQVGFEFARWPGEAADLAMKDAAQKFVEGFAKLPEITAWLQRAAVR